MGSQPDVDLVPKLTWHLNSIFDIFFCPGYFQEQVLENRFSNCESTIIYSIRMWLWHTCMWRQDTWVNKSTLISIKSVCLSMPEPALGWCVGMLKPWLSAISLRRVAANICLLQQHSDWCQGFHFVARMKDQTVLK